MFQELGEGTDIIHGEAREALPDGLRRRLNPPKPRGKAKAPRPITCRTAIDQPLNRRQVSASCPQLLHAERTAGLSNPRVFRSADDKSEIVVVFDTKDTKTAKDFAASPDLRETMAKAGVMDDPTIYFLDTV